MRMKRIGDTETLWLSKSQSLSLSPLLPLSLHIPPLILPLSPFRQLIQLCDLYDTDYLQAHLYPIAKTLAEDKVAEVRATATQLVSALHANICHSPFPGVNYSDTI